MRSLVTFTLLLVACEQQSAPPPAAAPPPGPPPPVPQAACRPGPPTCSPDRRALVAQCGPGWMMLQSCLGPQGCSVSAQGIACDESVAQPGEPCRAEGAYGCSADSAAMLQCRGGRQTVTSSCKGPKRCVVGGAVACDASVADPGDPCDREGKTACARDGRFRLRCARGVFAVSESCSQVACLSANGRVLCQ